MSPEPFPWRRIIGFGLGTLRLAPDAFWRMTPRELAAAMEALHGPALRPLGRDGLAALMARYPDAGRPSPALESASELRPWPPQDPRATDSSDSGFRAR